MYPTAYRAYQTFFPKPPEGLAVNSMFCSTVYLLPGVSQQGELVVKSGLDKHYFDLFEDYLGPKINPNCSGQTDHLG